MSDVTIEIKGADDLLKALEAAPDLARAEIETATRQSLLGLLDPLTDYPAAIPGSSYQRTGDLGRMWTTAPPEIKTMAHGFEGLIGNARPGVEYVQGDDQASVHRGRWKTASAAVKDAEGQIQARYQQAADRVAAMVDSAS